MKFKIEVVILWTEFPPMEFYINRDIILRELVEADETSGVEDRNKYSHPRAGYRRFKTVVASEKWIDFCKTQSKAFGIPLESIEVNIL